MPSIIEVDTIKNKTGTQNTVLSTDGSGNNTLNANTIKDGSATKTLATLSSSAVTLHSDVLFPTGHIIQTKGAIKDDPQLLAYTGAITGLAVDITPEVTGSKMLIYCTICFGRANGNSAYPFQIFRDSTQIARPASPLSSQQEGFDAGGNQTGDYSQFATFHHLDTHGINAGTQISYTIKVHQRDTNATVINKSYNDGNQAYNNRGVSSLTIMEIAP